MAYTIQTMNLTRRGETKAVTCGLVTTKTDMMQYMHDYWVDKHNTPWMVMGEDLSKEWSAHVNGGVGRIFGGFGNMVRGVATADPGRFFKGAVEGLLPGLDAHINADNDPFKRMVIWHRVATPRHYADGKVGVCVHCLQPYQLKG